MEFGAASDLRKKNLKNRGKNCSLQQQQQQQKT
jgi:hypothetical protein